MFTLTDKLKASLSLRAETSAKLLCGRFTTHSPPSNYVPEQNRLHWAGSTPSS